MCNKCKFGKVFQKTFYINMLRIYYFAGSPKMVPARVLEMPEIESIRTDESASSPPIQMFNADTRLRALSQPPRVLFW